MAVRQQSKQRIKGYQKIHAKQRVKERFGIDITSEDYDRMVAMINETGEAKFVKKLTNTRALFLIPYMDKEYYAIYNNKSKRIVTFKSVDQI